MLVEHLAAFMSFCGSLEPFHKANCACRMSTTHHKPFRDAYRSCSTYIPTVIYEHMEKFEDIHYN